MSVGIINTEDRSLPSIVRIIFILGGILAFIAGIQLFILSDSTALYFAWTIQPPITAAFIGALFWASSALFFLSARARSWAATRGALLTIFPFTTLLLIATLLHVDRFHLNSPNLLTRFVTWVWFAVYIALPPISLTLLIYQARMRFGGTSPRSPALPVASLLLGVQAAVEMIVGVGLFLVMPAVTAYWPWDLTPLTAQAIGAWLAVTGFAIGIVILRRDYIRLDVGAVGFSTIAALELIALVRFAGNVHWERLTAWVYLLFLLGMLVLGLYLLYNVRLPGDSARANQAADGPQPQPHH